jgi:hypothetical protein
MLGKDGGIMKRHSASIPFIRETDMHKRGRGDPSCDRVSHHNTKRNMTECRF